MLVQRVAANGDAVDMQEQTHHFTPSLQKLSRSDVHFPLTTPRKRAPSITSMSDVTTTQDGQTVGHLTIRGRESPPSDVRADQMSEDSEMKDDDLPPRSRIPFSVHDLPLEIQGKILDFIFGEVHSVNAAPTAPNGLSVSHSMRHPRRKAVAELALVSKPWRDLIQERIYRHIKIKGTRAGLAESEEYFCNHMHLTRHIRHIEFWVPVWGDKASAIEHNNMPDRFHAGMPGLAYAGDENLMTAHELLGFNFKLSVYTSTLSEIFAHIKCFFPQARIFTLEGGHCKKSNMIRHFPKVLFASAHQRLDDLPNIRTFAMRGAWNVMREYDHWATIERALPNVEEWHCSYAKPRQEAYTTINEILLRLPLRLRHVSVSLDGMYSKDDTTLGSNSLLSGMHMCEQLGRAAPHLESLSYTGKVCECFWIAAAAEAVRAKISRLQNLEFVVKSCCRQRVTNFHQETGETIVEELGGIMADGAGITNLVFVKAFERLVLGTVETLPLFPALNQIRIRYIDLDSPCALLNPYWHLDSTVVHGIWNEEILETLSEVRTGTMYEELVDGIGNDSSAESTPKKEDDTFDWRNTSVAGTGSRGRPPSSSGGGLYPKRKPKAIKTSSYRVLAEARGT